MMLTKSIDGIEIQNQNWVKFELESKVGSIFKIRNIEIQNLIAKPAVKT